MTMSNKATDLASEILFRIFRETSKETQITLQYVCKAWYYPARQVCFYSIHLQDKINVSQLIYCLESAGNLVKSLKIDQHTELCKQEMISLIHTCPELQELQIFNNSNYFQWLLQDDVLVNRLKSLSVMGRISWRSNGTNEYFYRLAHKYKSYLEKLEIILTCSPVFQQEFGGIMNYVSSFENLKHLIMMDGSRNVLVYFDQLLNICHGLENLKIGLGHPLFDPALGNPSLVPYPTMHQVDIFLPKFSISYFKYMMHRFVNLNEFHVRINQCKMDWENEKQEIIQFMINEYIPFIRKLTHSSLAIKIHDSSCIGDSFAYFTKMNENTVIDSLFEIHDGRHQRTDIKLDTKGNVSLGHYTFVRDFSSGSVELPYIKHLFTYGKNIKTLTINMSNLALRSIDLGLILDQCPNAIELELDLAQVWPRDCSWYDMMLVLNSTPNIYFNHGSSNKLSIIKLNGGMITPSLLDRISKQIPNMQHISLMNCTFFMDTQVTTKFDMSNLNLKSFIFDVKSFYHCSQPHTCFAITSADKSRYYLLDQYLDLFSEVSAIKQVDIEFIFNSIEMLQVHVGKFSKRQRIQLF